MDSCSREGETNDFEVVQLIKSQTSDVGEKRHLHMQGTGLVAQSSYVIIVVIMAR